MTRPLEGKVAAVTGSSRGIGKAIALELAAQGSDIAICARSERSTDELPGSIGESAEMIRVLGPRALAIRMDAAKDEDLRNMIERVIAEFGRVDVLVNNAAHFTSGDSFLDSDIDELDISHLVNVRGPYLLSLLAAKHMATAGGGTIINITSGAARNPAPPSESTRSNWSGGPVYGLTKAALDRFATGIAAELMTKNVAVINVNPGFTITERLERNPGRGMDLSRAERPETTAKAVAFLCGNPMPYTGQILNSRDVVAQNSL